MPVAEIHTGASLRPTKIELVQAWMGEQRWYAAKGQRPRLRLLTSWRLDDPEGEVGVETLVVADEAGPEPVVYQVPLTYRGEPLRSEEHTSELQSRRDLVCRLLLEKKKNNIAQRVHSTPLRPYTH